jgi:hypothetical protein
MGVKGIKNTQGNINDWEGKKRGEEVKARRRKEIIVENINSLITILYSQYFFPYQMKIRDVLVRF